MIDSPIDDFSKNTLGAVPGMLGKLLYVAGLRQNSDEYFHWGMVRSHGEASTSLAIGQSHTDLFIALLRTPIASLWQEVCNVALDDNTVVQEYIDKLTEKGDLLVPAQLQGGVRRHFNSILVALCCLAKAQELRAGRAA